MKLNKKGQFCIAAMALTVSIMIFVKSELLSLLILKNHKAHAEYIAGFSIGQMKENEKNIRLSFPTHIEGKSLDRSKETDLLVCEYISLGREIRALELKKQHKKNKILSEFGDCEFFDSSEGMVSYRKNKNGVRVLHVPL